MTRFYSLYSVHTAVDAWPQLLEAIGARLAPFAADPGGAPELTLSFEAADSPVPMPAAQAARCVYEFPDGHVVYEADADRLTVVVGDRIYAECEPSRGRSRVRVESPEASDLYTLAHPILSLLLMELLKGRGLYPVHAAGVVMNGCGVLLPGVSGAGKSTLSLALARRGYSFLADDTVFVQAAGSEWRVRAFPDQVDLCPDAVDLFPELTELGGERPPGWRKSQVRAESVYQTRIAWDAPPRVLIFPAVRGTPKSALRPLSCDEALFELAPNVLLTDAGRSQRHLDALAGLVRQCACYRLDTGRDLDDAVDVVRRAVA